MDASVDLGLEQAGPPTLRPATTSYLMRDVAGVRVWALLEIGSFLLAALVIDALWGANDRYAHLSLHPFWIVVLVASSYYGTSEGLAAVALSSLALLGNNLPQQQINEDGNVWLLRTLLLPLQWGLAALVLGSIRDALRERFDTSVETLTEARNQLQTITDAYERLHTLNQHLEARVAGQVCTVYAMYKASRAIEQQGVGAVLVGVMELVRTVMQPGKFSLFLLNGSQLEAVASEGWAADDTFTREIEAKSQLYDVVVMQRRFLVVADPADELLLSGEGVLAGPLVNGETGAVVGMLKIEAIGFLNLNLSNVQNFHILCEWVGAALANAQRVEDLKATVQPDGHPFRKGKA